MSKAKDVMEDLRNKVFERKKQESVEKAEEVIKPDLDNIIYDIIQDPSTSSRRYLALQIRYNLETKDAKVMEVRPFDDKTVGLSIEMNRKNIKYLFEKSKRGDKK